jgi:hypothetical protein
MADWDMDAFRARSVGPSERNRPRASRLYDRRLALGYKLPCARCTVSTMPRVRVITGETLSGMAVNAVRNRRGSTNGCLHRQRFPMLTWRRARAPVTHAACGRAGRARAGSASDVWAARRTGC